MNLEKWNVIFGISGIILIMLGFLIALIGSYQNPLFTQDLSYSGLFLTKQGIGLVMDLIGIILFSASIIIMALRGYDPLKIH